MTVFVTPQPYWSRVLRLVQYDGRRALWRVAAGGLIITAIPGLAVGGVVAGIYIAGDLSNATCVVIGALLGLASPLVAERAWRRRWWRDVVARRLWSFERAFSGQPVVSFAVRQEDCETAVRALRRAHFAPEAPRPLPAPRPEAPRLTYELTARRPASQTLAGEDALAFRDRVARVLEQAGIEHVPHSHGNVG